MKFLAILLSVYILVVTVFQCCCDCNEKDFINQKRHHETSSLPHDDCNGVCSPFCLCNNCAGFTIELIFNNYQKKIQKTSENIIVFTQQIYSTPSLKDIWRPPKNFEL
ncbi:MAG: hypothetical protein LBV69_07565 [Bacteroidales bacterium]|jgi:hypothetical protein|nr:hypothetical protein [Bacteroidales bacterium]